VKAYQKWVGLVTLILALLLVGDLYAQQTKHRAGRNRSNRFGWKGPDIGSVIKDFELPILKDGTFKLSDYRGKIVVLEFGACT